MPANGPESSEDLFANAVADLPCYEEDEEQPAIHTDTADRSLLTGDRDDAPFVSDPDRGRGRAEDRSSVRMQSRPDRSHTSRRGTWIGASLIGLVVVGAATVAMRGPGVAKTSQASSNAESSATNVEAALPEITLPASRENVVDSPHADTVTEPSIAQPEAAAATNAAPIGSTSSEQIENVNVTDTVVTVDDFDCTISQSNTWSLEQKHWCCNVLEYKPPSCTEKPTSDASGYVEDRITTTVGADLVMPNASVQDLQPSNRTGSTEKQPTQIGDMIISAGDDVLAEDMGNEASSRSQAVEHAHRTRDSLTEAPTLPETTTPTFVKAQKQQCDFKYTGGERGECFCQLAGNDGCSRRGKCYCDQGCNKNETHLQEQDECVSFRNPTDDFGCGSTSQVLTVPRSYFSDIRFLYTWCPAGMETLLAAMLTSGFSSYQAINDLGATQAVRHCLQADFQESRPWLHLHTFCADASVDTVVGPDRWCASMSAISQAPALAANLSQWSLNWLQRPTGDVLPSLQELRRREQPSSCMDIGCGMTGPAEHCSCDKKCTSHDNCCVDFAEVCSAPPVRSTADGSVDEGYIQREVVGDPADHEEGVTEYEVQDNSPEALPE